MQISVPRATTPFTCAKLKYLQHPRVHLIIPLDTVPLLLCNEATPRAEGGVDLAPRITRVYMCGRASLVVASQSDRRASWTPQLGTNDTDGLWLRS